MRMLFLFLLLLTNSAFSAEFEFFYDAGRLPVCVREKGARWYEGKAFLWNQNSAYKRQVYVVPLVEFRNMQLDPLDRESQLHVHLTCQALIENSAYELRQKAFEWIDGSGKKYRNRFALNQEEVKKYPAIQPQIWQILEGYSEFLPENDAAKYWQKNAPSEGFTLRFNEEISRKFGAAFAAKVYEQSLLQDKQNEKLLAAVKKNFAQSRAGQKLPLKEKLSRFVFVFEPGFLNDKHVDRLNPVYELFASLGVEAIRSEFNPAGSIEENSEILARTVEGQLKRGKRVVVGSVSKGGLEAYHMFTHHGSRLEKVAQEHKGELAAFLNLSGVIQGNFILDYVESYGFLGRLIARHKTNQMVEKDKVNVPPHSTDYEGLFEMSTKKIQKNWGKTFASTFPKNVTILSLIGVATEADLSEDSYVRQVQEDLLRSRMGFHPANDGFVTYPNNEVPKAWARKNYNLPIAKASHALMDGEFDGISLRADAERYAFMAALLNALPELLEGEAP